LARPNRREGVGTGVLFVDLDGFKVINDTFGHAAGDEVLQTVAHRLRELTRPSDTIGRLGGDEFAVVIPGTGQPRLTQLAAAIDGALSEPHRIYGRIVTVSGSIGTHLALAGDDAKAALHAADTAMYAAKQKRKLHEASRQSK